MLVQSTGSQLVPLPPLKTKVNADLAGLSLLLVDLKVFHSSGEKIFKAFLNNNLLIAQHHMETMDAMEVLWTMPSSMLLQTEFALKLNIHTKQLMEHAK